MYNENYKYKIVVDLFVEGNTDWEATLTKEGLNDFETLIFYNMDSLDPIFYRLFGGNGDSVIKNSYEIVTFTGAPPLRREDFLGKLKF
jgi:hypothetical protein